MGEAGSTMMTDHQWFRKSTEEGWTDRISKPFDHSLL